MYDLLASQPLAVRFFIAFLVVLVLIGLTAWLVRRFGANRIGGAVSRGRQPRLAVIDAAAVDGRRRLVLIRRDNVEHLLMIGGPSDLVVEPNIVRAVSAGPREPVREPPRAVPEPAARQASPPESAWPVQPSHEPGPPPRNYRASVAEESWQAPEPPPPPRPRTPDSLSGLAAELTARLNPSEASNRHETPPRTVAPPPPLAPEPVTPSPSDHNLAEMAHQLEAALRRGPSSEARPPVTDPLAVNPLKPAEFNSRPSPRDFMPRPEPRFDARPEGKREPRLEPKPDAKFEPKFEPKFETKFETKFDTKLEPKFEPKFEPIFEQAFEPKPEPKVEAKPEAMPEAKLEPVPRPSKNMYENLEDEMASLLGRPSGKN